MPCQDAILKDIYTVSPDMSVENALKFIHEKNVRAMPVIDENGNLLGMLSLSILLEHLLPVAARINEGLEKLGFITDADPGIAKRFKKEKIQVVSDIMKKDIVSVDPTTHLWEVIRLIVKNGSPLTVVEEGTKKLLGIITEQSAIDDLERILIVLEKQNEDMDED